MDIFNELILKTLIITHIFFVYQNQHRQKTAMQI